MATPNTSADPVRDDGRDLAADGPDTQKSGEVGAAGDAPEATDARVADREGPASDIAIVAPNGPRPHSPDRLPRGRHGLSREQVVASQRQRILDAMAELCAEQSYPAVRIAEIVGRAGVSRATFYELFRDKEDCFVAAMEEALKRLFNAVMPAAYSRPDRPWPERVADAIEALLGCIATHQKYSQMAMVEALAGGERTFERYTVASQVLVTLLDQGRFFAPPEARIPSTAARAALGASEAIIIDEMLSGRVDRIPDLLPDLLYIALTPYVGQAEALRHVAAARESI